MNGSGTSGSLAAWLLLCAASAWATEIRWQAPVEIARGAGERGAWQQNESRYDFVDDPAVAWSPRGELAVAWVDQRRKAVLLQRYAANAEMLLAAPIDVSRQPQTFSWLPRLAWAPDGAEHLYALWQEIIFSGGSHGGEILFGVSDDGGRSFSQPMNLSRSSEGDGKGRINRNIWHNGSLDIATAPGGLVFAAWTEYDGRLWFARSGDRGRNFSKPLLVAGDPPNLPARAPALAAGIDGAVVLAWASGDDPAGDIRIARSIDGGRSFSAPQPVAVTPDYSDAPKLAFDTRAVLHLVHTESCGGPFKPSSIRHLRSTDGGRSFGPAREISTPLPGGYASAAHAALGIDGRGRVVVIWELLRGPAAPPYGLGIAISADGVQFSAPQLIPGSVDPEGGFNGSTQGLLMNKLAVRADGEIAVVNSAVKIGSHSRVWLLRGAVR
jgi:hypothetical protein